MRVRFTPRMSAASCTVMVSSRSPRREEVAYLVGTNAAGSRAFLGSWGETGAMRPSGWFRLPIMALVSRSVRSIWALSNREAEILSLYALGMTQGRIADELHVSQSTVHTHIVHIYTKTGLHSRQELMDLMDDRYRVDGP